MAIEIFYVSGSPYSWRVMLAAEVKGVPYTARLLSLSKHEHRSPEYLKMNPRGRTPLLKDGDFVVTESLAMMVYLDSLSPTNPLFGTNPKESARVWEAVSEIVFDFEKAGLQFAQPVLFGSPTAGSAEPMKAGAEKLLGELKLVEERLGKHAFLVGDGVTAADVAAFPLVMFMQRAASNEIARTLDLGILPLATKFPNVAAWIKRFEAMPFYDKIYPPHWRA
ncbi:MAG: glutathione S-transferase family protein [Bauldia sp.]